MSSAAGRAADVLVVGAGPVGSAVLLALHRAGVSCCGVDRLASPSEYPKARVLTTRSMELLRRWGLADRVRAASLDGPWADTLVVSSGVCRRELVRITRPDRGPRSPERPALCTQDRLEGILRAELLRAGAHLRTSSTVVGVRDGDAHAEVDVVDAAGVPQTLRSRFIVLVDGARGIGAGDAVPGSGRRRVVARQVSLRVRLPLPRAEVRRAFIQYVLKRGLSAQLLVVDGRDEWVVSSLARRAATAADYSPARCRALLSEVTGLPEDHPTVRDAVVRDVRCYDIALRVADEFRQGRILRAGDAAHEVPPTGAMGLNLGLADADALAWRLRAIITGWADATVLDDYARERRVQALRVAAWTRGNLAAVTGLLGALARGDDRASRDAQLALRGYLDYAGLDAAPAFGHDDLPPDVVIEDGSPGARAPHVGTDESSLLDHFGSEPVVVAGRDWTEPVAAARSKTRIPVRLAEMPAGCEWWSRCGVRPDGGVLVRPDGIVAARWATAAADLETELRRLAGHPIRSR